MLPATLQTQGDAVRYRGPRGCAGLTVVTARIARQGMQELQARGRKGSFGLDAAVTAVGAVARDGAARASLLLRGRAAHGLQLRGRELQ